MKNSLKYVVSLLCFVLLANSATPEEVQEQDTTLACKDCNMLACKDCD